MKRKRKQFIAVILSGMMIFSTTGFAFADTEEETTQTEPVKIEKEVEQPQMVEQPKQEETQKEEIQQEEPKEEIQVQGVKKVTEEKTTDPIVANELKEEPKEEVVPVEKVTVKFFMMGPSDWTKAQGDWTATKSGSKKKSYYGIPAYNQGQPVVTNDSVRYIFQEKWEVKINGNVVKTLDADIEDNNARFYGKDFIALAEDNGLKGPQPTLEIYAKYEIIMPPIITFKYQDNIGNTSGSEQHKENGKVGYSHTFKNAADVPEQYSFKYWESFDTEKYWEKYDKTNQKKANEKISFSKELEFGQNITVTYTTVYDFQPSVKVVYHYKNGSTYVTQSYIEPIDIYESASIQGLDWYYDTSNKNLVAKGSKAELPDVIPNITELQEDNPIVVDVYEKNPVPTPTPDPEPPVVTPDKPDPKVVTKTKTNNTITYYGMGDGTVSTPEPTHTVLPTTKTPFTAPAETGAWAFLNLLAVLANFVVCIFLLLMAFINNKKEDDETEVKNRMLGRICTLIIAIVSGIIFLLTEDMSLPMVWVDQWTVLMICTFVLQLIVGFLSRHKEEEIEQEHE